VSTRAHLACASSAISISIVIFVSSLAGACGKKGPPLPPLVRLPAAPAEFRAERRGSTVDLQFTVPNANTDGTRPANVTRVDVYGFTGRPDATDDQLLKEGTKVASVEVKTPRDPDRTIDPDESRNDMEPLVGEGPDQGAVVHVEEDLTAAALAGVAPPREASGRETTTDGHSVGPLLGATAAGTPRTYLSVAVSKRGRRGPVSKRAAISLAPPPPMPSAVSIAYDETSITVTWTPPLLVPGGEAPPGSDVLPSKPLGEIPSTLAYNVYDTSTRTLLNKTPVAEPRYLDARIEWGARRCYAVRAVETTGPFTIESDAPPPVCSTLVDKFPPAPPKGLVAVASVGEISLIWQSNQEKDLGGYLVLRGVAPAEQLQPITLSPIQEPTFRDAVQPGIRYVYAVQAVDKAGNSSELSNRVSEAAR